jgi:hypothetical protein
VGGWGEGGKGKAPERNPNPTHDMNNLPVYLGVRVGFADINV